MRENIYEICSLLAERRRLSRLCVSTLEGMSVHKSGMATRQKRGPGYVKWFSRSGWTDQRRSVPLESPASTGDEGLPGFVARRRESSGFCACSSQICELAALEKVLGMIGFQRVC